MLDRLSNVAPLLAVCGLWADTVQVNGVFWYLTISQEILWDVTIYHRISQDTMTCNKNSRRYHDASMKNHTLYIGYLCPRQKVRGQIPIQVWHPSTGTQRTNRYARSAQARTAQWYQQHCATCDGINAANNCRLDETIYLSSHSFPTHQLVDT